MSYDPRRDQLNGTEVKNYFKDDPQDKQGAKSPFPRVLRKFFPMTGMGNKPPFSGNKSPFSGNKLGSPSGQESVGETPKLK